MSKFDLPIYVGMATFGNRPVLECLSNIATHVDKIILHDNEKPGNKDLKDNGKFCVFNEVPDPSVQPVYIFLCDDDIYYPPNYWKATINAIKRYGCIISHHGRVLTGGAGVSYFRNHKTVGFKWKNEYLGPLDVAGTGVTAFRSDYWLPKGLHLRSDYRVSDLIFSLEALKAGKEIRTIPHDRGWLRQLDIDHNTSCHTIMSRGNPLPQQYADQIVHRKNIMKK